MSGSGGVIHLKDISKRYRLYKNKADRLKESLHPLKKKLHNDFFALKDINIEVNKSEILGVVGMNGSGKSTLLKIIAGIIQPSTGLVSTSGRVIPLLELGSGFNKEFTGMENVRFYCTMHGNTPKQTQALIPKILDFAEIGNFISQPLKTYSSGMKARLAFAVSINVNPDILILDEILSVGDVLFRRKSFAKMEEIFKSGKTVIYVSHDINSVNQLCTRAIFIDKGELLLDGPPKLVTMYYQKYVFTKASEQVAFRNLIKELNKDEDRKRDFELEKTDLFGKENNQKESDDRDHITDTAFFIPNFHPKSTLKTQNHDVQIFDIGFTTLKGKQVNVLMTGNKYIYSFKVKFNLDVRNVTTAVPFKTEKSVVVTGGVNRSKMIKKVNMGSIYQIDWHFNCDLLQGTYFTNIAVSGEFDGERDRLVRIIDASVFKVQTANEDDFIGLTQMNQHPVVKLVE